MDETEREQIRAEVLTEVHERTVLNAQLDAKAGRWELRQVKRDVDVLGWCLVALVCLMVLMDARLTRRLVYLASDVEELEYQLTDQEEVPSG